MSEIRALSFVIRVLPTLILVITLATGCVSNLSENGGPCPCGPGWTCCEVDNVCLRNGEMCLTDDQKLLVALEGTWIGTASEAGTMSGTNRIVMEMVLPTTGEPTLEGLTGGLWFGEELDTSPVDPEFPRIDDGSIYLHIRDGFIFTLLNMAILDGRLLAEFDTYEQWTEFCEAQTEIYNVGGDVYTCKPTGTGWWGEEGEGPNGEPGILYHGPNSEEVFISAGKEQLCLSVCACELSGCTVDVNHGSLEGQLDISVNVDSGVMLGTGSEGRIEAVKQ